MFEVIAHIWSGKSLVGRFADEADAETWMEDVFLPSNANRTVSARIVFNRAVKGMPEFRADQDAERRNAEWFRDQFGR